MNKFFKMLCSVPVILVTLYFVPFLGICLLLFRYYIYKSSKKNYVASIWLLICGFTILVPKIFVSVIKMMNLNITIPYLNTIVTSNIYDKLVKYSRLIIIIGIISMILCYVLKSILTNINNKLSFGVKKYIEKDLEQDYKIREKNDMRLQEKREISKNTHVVKCPYCGADNMLTSSTGICKYCRRNIK